MNERIQELAKQASDGVAGTGFTMAKYNEKFAELIVQECIQASEARAKALESQPTDPLLRMYDNGIVSGIFEATETIKEHFGIAE